MRAETILVCPDTHWAPATDKEGGADERAVNCMLRAIGIVKPNTFVHIGDAGEWSSVSGWRYKRRKRPPINYTLDALTLDSIAVNEGLDLIDAELPRGTRKHFIQGNHERWVDFMHHEFMKNDHDESALDEKYQLRNLLRLKKRRYAFHPYGDYVKFGKLFMYHGGHYSGKYHTYRHLEALGSNVLYGHTHDHQVARVNKLGGAIGAWSIGCLAKLHKPFLDGRPTNWTHAFAIIHVEPSGEFHVEMVEIYNGRCYVQGRKVAG